MFFCFCYPDPWLALQLGLPMPGAIALPLSQPSAFQAAAGQDSKQKNTFEAAKVFFFCYPDPWLALQPGLPMPGAMALPLSQPSAFQAAAGEDGLPIAWLAGWGVSQLCAPRSG